jgi:MFS family permease
MIGAAFAALASYGTFSWVPALFQRRFGWSPAHIGGIFGAVTVLCGIGGLVASGALASRLAAAGHKAPYSSIMVGSVALSIIPAALFVAVPNPYWTIGCLALMVFLLSTPIGLVQTALQAVTPNQMRAQVIAVYLLATALIGTALGPSSVAAVTDFWFHDDRQLGASIAVVATAAAVLSTVILGSGIRAYADADRLRLPLR